MFQLSRTKVSAINDDGGVLSILKEYIFSVAMHLSSLFMGQLVNNTHIFSSEYKNSGILPSSDEYHGVHEG